MSKINIKAEELTKQCSLCESEFDDPRQLKCTHSFCLKCLQHHMVVQPNRKGVVCPQCEQRTRIPEGKLECLPINMMYNEQKRETKTGGHRDQIQEQEGKERYILIRLVANPRGRCSTLFCYIIGISYNR